MFFKRHEHLIDLNGELLIKIFKALQINTIKPIYTNNYTIKPEIADLRNSFHPKKNTHEANPIEFPRYIQVFDENNGFIPDLSILDLLFNLGPDALPYLAKVQLNFQI